MTGQTFNVDYFADGLATAGKNLSFMLDARFHQAWQFSVEGNKAGWKGQVPDIRWRKHIACWAASHALTLDGDFVECGVHTGLLSMTICSYLDFEKTDRNFYLFDTFNGIPIDQLRSEEKALGLSHNQHIYFDCYDIAQRNFAAYPNVHLIRGRLPDTLTGVPLSKIAYLSMDLNNANAEEMTIRTLWEKLVPGAVVVLDDYGFTGHEAQYTMWNGFAREKGRMIATLPTGQGLLIK